MALLGLLKSGGNIPSPLEMPLWVVPAASSVGEKKVERKGSRRFAWLTLLRRKLSQQGFVLLSAWRWRCQKGGSHVIPSFPVTGTLVQPGLSSEETFTGLYKQRSSETGGSLCAAWPGGSNDDTRTRDFSLHLSASLCHVRPPSGSPFLASRCFPFRLKSSREEWSSPLIKVHRP